MMRGKFCFCWCFIRLRRWSLGRGGKKKSVFLRREKNFSFSFIVYARDRAPNASEDFWLFSCIPNANIFIRNESSQRESLTSLESHKYSRQAGWVDNLLIFDAWSLLTHRRISWRLWTSELDTSRTCQKTVRDMPCWANSRSLVEVWTERRTKNSVTIFNQNIITLMLTQVFIFTPYILQTTKKELKEWLKFVIGENNMAKRWETISCEGHKHISVTKRVLHDLI